MTRRRGKDSGKRADADPRRRGQNVARVHRTELEADEPATTGAAEQPNKRRPIDEPIE